MLLWYFKGVNQRFTEAVILQLCKTVKENSIEKEPLTLEKDKGDQGKYYICYPKPPVLDMKWESRDINVEEWANIPKFPLLVNED